MAQRKDNTLLYVAIGAAVIGYMAYKKGLIKLPGMAVVAPVPAVAQSQSPAGIAIETPTAETIGIYQPGMDPTGDQISLF